MRTNLAGFVMARPSDTITRMRLSSTPSATVMAAPANTVSAATTITVENPPQQPQQQPQTLTLKLKRKGKKVSWKEGTIDNEFMQKRSSKKCCIFHKEKSFDEDCSDDDDDHDHNYDHHRHDHESDGAGSSKDNGGGEN